MRRLTICCIALTLLLPLIAQAKIYKWVDADGKHYSDFPPCHSKHQKNPEIKQQAFETQSSLTVQQPKQQLNIGSAEAAKNTLQCMGFTYRTSSFAENAARNGNIDAVRLLLEAGKDIEAKSTIVGRTRLYTAAAFGHNDVVELLLEQGAAIDGADDDGRTPLLFASGKSGTPETVETLLTYGAKIKPENNGGYPLHWAAREDKIEIVRLYLAQGADINARDRGGWTPPQFG